MSLFLKEKSKYLLFLLVLLSASVPALAQLSGPYTIDPGSSASKTNYQNFASAVGDMLSGSRTDGGTANGPNVKAAVTFNVANGTYNEQVQLSAVTGASATNTITFESAKGDSSKVILTQTGSIFSGTNYTLLLNNASYISFKKMTISRTGSYPYQTVVEINGGSNANNFLNCQVIGRAANQNTTNQSLFYSPADNDSGNTFENNYLLDGSYGFYWYGNSTSSLELNNTIQGNIFDSTYYNAIDAYYQRGLNVFGNSVINMVSSNGTVFNFYYILGLNDSGNTIIYNNSASGYGMYLYYCDTSLRVVGNKVYLANGAYAGIYLNYCIGTANSRLVVANNMVSVGGNNSSAIYGIYSFEHGWIDFLYNSILVTNTNVNSYGLWTEGFYSYQQDNIEDNISSNTGGGSAAYIYYWDLNTVDYNDWYTTSSSEFVTWGGYSPPPLNLVSLQAQSGKDANSVSANPYFLSSVNLHAIGPKLYKAGTPLYITDDIDGQSRSLTAPCIGADEFTLPSFDAGITAINNISGNYCAGTNSVFVTITNFGSANLTSAKINWQVNDTTQAAYSWTGSLSPGGASSVNIGTYTFKNSDIYSLKTWTSSPNGGTDGNNANDTAMISNLRQGLTGTYTIGASGDYTTFGAAVSDLALHGVCGPIVFNVASGSYNEQISIGPITGTSATNTVTFQSATGDSTKVNLNWASSNSNTNNYTVQLNGAAYVNFKEITISRTGALSWASVIDVRGGSSYNTFWHDQILGEKTASNGTNLATVFSGQDNDNNNVFRGNLVRFGAYGFYWYGSSSNTRESNNIIDGNIIDSAYYEGISIGYQNAIMVTRNIVQNIVNTSGYGIYSQWCSVNNTISKNRIVAPLGLQYGIYNQYDDQNSQAQSNRTINNIISIGGAATSYGIYDYWSLNSSYLYNSILITSTNTAAVGFYVYSPYNDDSLIDNICANIGGGLAISNSNWAGLSTSNYNDLYVSSGSSYLGSWIGTNVSNLAAWQTISGLDVNSVSANPGFISNTNLTPTSAVLYHTATPLKGITDDINGASRNATTPDMGAIEFLPISLDAGISNIDGGLTNFCGGKQNVNVTITNSGLTTLTAATVSWQVNGASATNYSWTGSITTGKSASVNVGTFTFNAASTYVIKAWTSSPNGGTDLNNNNDTDQTGTLYSGMSGTFNIGGPSADYSTFNLAVKDLKLRGVCGPVTFNVHDSVYNEQLTIPAISRASSTNTITFQSSSKDSTKVTLTTPANYGANNYTLGLNGAQYITFKQITINRSGNGGYGCAVELMNNASNDNFFNNIFSAVNTTNSSNYWALVSSVSSLDTANVFRNNYLLDGSYGFYFQGPSTTTEANSNIFDGNFIDSAYYMGMYLYYESGMKVTNNSIFNLGYANQSYGIYSYQCVSPWISKNIIDSFAANTGLFVGYASGNVNITKNRIYLFGGYGIYSQYNKGASNMPCIIANNYITVGGTGVTYGIYDYYPTYEDIAYNNINITNTNTSSTCFYAYTCCSSPSAASTLFRNNILVNTGGGYSIYVPNWSWTQFYSTGALISNNDYYATGSNFIYSGGNTYAFSASGLASWQSAISGDANSLLVDPGYTSNVNLMATSSSLKDAGTGVSGITDDIQGYTRPQNKTDIGANQLFLYTNDAGVSAITPTIPFAPGPQNVTATFENFGTKTLTSVTVDWTINGAAQSAYVWTGSLATGKTATVTLGSNTFNTGSSYDLKAWTFLPNSGADADHNNDTFEESACAALAAGIYTIDASGSGSNNFTSFTNAVNAMGCGGIAGPVIFKVASGTYTEQVTITSILGTSNANRVTFIGAAKDSSAVTLTYSSSSSSNYTLYMNGGSFVTFRDITIEGTNTSYGTAVRFSNNPSNDSFVNCIIEGPSTTSNTSNLANIYYSASASINPVTFYNNVILNGAYGSFWSGTSGNHSETTSFIHNQFTNQYAYGAYFQYVADVYFNNNVITSNTSNTNYYGLYSYWLESTSRNSEIENNKIYGGMSGYGMYLTYISVNSGINTYIENNSVLMGSTTQTNPCYGVYALWYNPGVFYNNTFVVYGTSLNNYAMSVNPQFSATGSDIVKNNIFANLGNGTTSYGVALSTQNITWYVSDYNDYYVLNGGNIASNGGANYTSFASWKTAASPNDANSQAVDPDFASATDLNISDLCLRGTNLGITTDINGTTRSVPPSMGAYEASGGATNDIGVDAVEGPVQPFSAGSQNIVVRIRNYGSNVVTSGKVTYSVNGSSPVTVSFSGSLNQCDTMQVVFSGSNQFNFASGNRYIVKSWTSLPNGSSDNRKSNDTFLSNPLCVQMSGTYTINPLGSGTNNFTSFTAAVNELECAGLSGPVVFNISDGTYYENVYLSTIPGSSSSNTVLFQSANSDSSNVVLSGTGSSSANYTFDIDGASYVTIRKITIQSNNSTYGIVLDIQDRASHDSIYNCQLIGVSTNNTNNTLSVVFSTNSVDNNNVFLDNLIQNGSFGFYYPGNNQNTNQMESGTVIQNNILQNQFYMGMYLQYQNAVKVIGNVITTNSTYTNYFGMELNYTNNASRILKNKISGAVGGYGIYNNFTNWATNTNPAAIIANNFISIGAGANSATGIYNEYALDQYYYYNSVNVLSSGGGANYAAMYNYTPYSSPNVNVEDNIFANTSATAGGYAYYLYSGSAYVNTENYNDYYVATGANLLSLSGTNYNTVSSWNTATGLDANSIQAYPGFYSATDLHSNASAIYQGGKALASVTDDIDGQARPATKPCIGADEFKVYANDAGAYAITAPVPGFCAGSTKNVDVTIKNYSNASLTSVNILFYINGAKKITYAWTGSLAANDTTTVGIGSTVFPAGNLTCVAKTTSPNGLVDSNSTNDSIISPLSPALSGTYKIGGSGADFATFSAAATALNTRGLCGAVTFNVANGTYNEQIVLKAIANSSAINTVTFQSTSGDSSKVILTNASSGSPATGYTVDLDGASYVTFRQITISSTGNNYYANVVQLNNGASHDQILNCQLFGITVANTANAQAVVFAQTVAGRDTSNLIQNNLIENGSYGVYFSGTTSSVPSSTSNTCDSGNHVIGNTISGSYYEGIYGYYQEAFVASANTISGIGATNGQGIYSFYCDNSQYTKNYISGINNSINYGMFLVDCNNSLRVSKNQLYLPNGAAAGIYLQSCIGNSTYPIVVSNNMVSIGGSAQSYGIDDYYTDYCSYLYNSILITGPNANSACFYSYNYYNSPLTIENNAGYNKGGGYAVYISYGYYIKSAGVMNYNDWISTGSYLGYWQGTTCALLSNWKSTSGVDNNAISLNPLYNSASDLHAANSKLAAGTPVASVTDDIDAQTRSASTPDIGADEFGVSPLDAGVISANMFNYCGGKQTVNVTIANFGSTTLASASIGWTVNGTAQTPFVWTGSLASGDTVSVNIGSYSFSSGSYIVKAWTYSPNSGTDGNHKNDTALATNILQGMSGTYTIGGGAANYISFTNAVKDLVSRGICGPVTFNVNAGAYYEQVSVPSIYGSSAANTITFQSLSGDSSSVDLNYGNDFVLQLYGANHTIFKSITIRCSSASQYISGGVVDIRGGANNNQFLHNRILGNKDYYYYYGSYLVYSGTDKDTGNIFKENLLRNGNYGFYITTASGTLFDKGTVIQDNIIDSTGYTAIYASFQDSIYIYRNQITNLALNNNSSNVAVYGIEVVNSHNKFIVGKNKVSPLTGGYGIYIVNNTNTATTAATVYDNFASLQGSNQTSYGIYGQGGAYVNYYYNNVFTNDTMHTSADVYYNATSHMNSENNIFVNKSTGYAIDVQSGASYIDSSDYNDYYSTGSYLGYYGIINEGVLSDWQGAMSKDYFSISVDPGFTSVTDLHVSNNALKGKAVSIPAITDDIDGRPRGTTPDIGATQVTPAAKNDMSVLGLYSPQSGQCGTANEQIALIVYNAGANPQLNIPLFVSVTGSTTKSLYDTIKANIPAGVIDTFYFATTFNAANGGTYNITGYTNLSTDQNRNNDTLAPVTITLLKVPANPSTTSASRCGAGSVKLAANTVSGVDHFWYSTSVPATPVGYGDTFTTPVLNSTTTYYATASAHASNSLKTFYSGATSYQGVMFDINAHHNIRVDSFDANIQGSGTDNVDVYYRNGTFVGNETNSSAWTLAGTTTVTINGAGSPSHIALSAGISVPAGNILGIYIRLHTNPNLRVTSGNNNISNYDLTLSEGKAITGSFTSAVASKSYNGQVYYTVWGCSSSTVAATATINYGPQGAGLTKGSPFNGNFNGGTSSNPDGVCVNQDATYGVNPPTGFNNSDYGTKWKIISTSMATASGNATTHYTFNGSTSGSTLKYSPTSADADSTYIVTITLQNQSTGCDTTFSRYIYTSPLPSVSFTYASGCSGQYTAFTNTSTYGSGTPAVIWYFGDGDTSSALSPNHIYSTAKSYNVKLVIVNASGCSDSVTNSVKIIAPPSAKFGAVGSCLNDSISFVDSSSATPSTISSWAYDFGDGSGTSTAQNPNYKYSSPGTYTVKLLVTNANGCVDSTTRSVVVNASPVAAFGANNLCATDSAAFTDSSSISSGSISTYHWDFGDGNSSSSQNPKHKYTSSGSYTVKLTINSLAGCSDSVSKSVTIVGAPTAKFSSSNGCFGDSTSFTDKSTGSIIAWSWKFGDGGTSAIQNPNHLYATSGNYTVTLYAYTGIGCSDSATSSVTIYPKPTAKFSATTVCGGNATVFTDSSSVATGSIASHMWYFGDGDTSTAASPGHMYTLAGNYNVKEVVASNNGCKDSVTHSVTVNSIPVAKFGALNGCNGTAVQFADSSTGTISTYLWRFGDGTTSNGKAPAYKYADTGTYNVTLIVSNGSCADSISHTVHVYGLPTAGFSNGLICANNATTFTDKSTAASGTTIAGWAWNFGDGGTSANQSPTYTYLSSGTYTVRLIVTSNKGCVDTTTTSVSVSPQPNAVFLTGSVCVGTSTIFTNKTLNAGSFTFLWNFGDGDTSTATSPSHLYTNAGTYYAKLTATNGSGCYSIDSQLVTVNSIPTAKFSSAVGCVNSPTSFTDSSVTNPATTNYFWKFGDGVTSTLRNPVHIFKTVGNFWVYHQVTNSSNCVDTLTQEITVSGKPVAGFKVGPSCVGTLTQFTDTSTGGVTYSWDFGDGSTSTLQSPSHAYQTTLTEIVKERVFSAGGCEDSFMTSVTPAGFPDPSFSDTISATNKLAAKFYANNPTLNNYRWNFGDGSVDTSGADALTSHTYAKAGTYNVTLTTLNASGCSADSTEQVTVGGTGIDNSLASKLNLAVYPNPFTQKTNITYTLTKGAEVYVSVIDETGREIATLSNGMQSTGTHEVEFDADKYNASAGLYLLRITVNNETVHKQIIRLK